MSRYKSIVQEFARFIGTRNPDNSHLIGTILERFAVFGKLPEEQKFVL
jgi:hypothetical protein